MGRYVSGYWQPRLDAPAARERRGGRYQAYVPDPLGGWTPRLSLDVVATAGDASAAVRALNTRHAADSPHPLDTFAHVLLRVEAMASSRIEAINPSARRILTAEAEQREGGRPSDRAATEVLGNLEAMETAIRVATTGGPLRTTDLLEVHTRLMATSPHPHLGGWVRDTQNWIGANAYTPVGASYVPPPAEQVPALLDDLVAYMNRSDIPPLIQAGIAHAQFETIHPFADGNGRVGRALIHAVLHQRNLAPAFVPPISAALARSPNVYFDGLTAYRHEGAPTDPGRDQAAEQWLGVFLEATYDACHEAQRYLDAVSELETDLRARAAPIRRGSAADLLVGLLPARPVFTVTTAAATIGRSTVTTGQAINRLTQVGILTVRSVGKQRYRVFEAPDITRLIASLDTTLTTQNQPTTP